MKSVLFLCYLFAIVPLVAQTDEGALSPKLKTLQESYEAAVFRAKKPITVTYIRELEKLKAEYTRSGDLTLAVSTDELIEQAPFTDSVATITIDPLLSQAKVAHSNGTFYDAKISEKERR